MLLWGFDSNCSTSTGPKSHTLLEMSGPSMSLHPQWMVSPPTLSARAQPPCCCFTNLPQLWSGLFFSSVFQGHVTSHCPRGGWHSRQTLILTRNVFSFAFLVSVLWRRKQLRFYKWVHRRVVTQFRNHHQSLALIRPMINAVKLHQA